MAKVKWHQALPHLLLLLLLALVSSTPTVLREEPAGPAALDDVTHRSTPLDDVTHHSTPLYDVTHHSTPLDDVRHRNFASREVRARQDPQDHTLSWGGAPAATAEDGGPKTDANTSGGDSVERRTLRIAVFSDPTLLDLLAAHHPLHPPTAAHQYITMLVSAVENLLQQGVGAGVELRLRLVQVGVWAAREAVPFRTEGPSSSTLYSFCQWVSQRRPARGHQDHWHHAMLLSGQDLFESTPSPLGTTYVGGLCHPRTSCSVVEAQSFKAVHVAAHELAHSIGVPHDGAPDAAHCPKDGFLMGQSLTQTSFRWSNCSRDALAAILMKDGCLEVSQAGLRELDHNREELPGQMYPADEQCRLALGQEYKATPSKMSICEYLTCTDGLRTQGVHPALEGTSCGNNRVCIAGSCRSHQFPAKPPPTTPPTRPPTRPPTGIPGFPSDQGSGGGSVFPPAIIPGEVGSVPMPLRCSLLPPFLHVFVGCSSPVSSPQEHDSSPSRPTELDEARALVPIPASRRMDTIAIEGGLTDPQAPEGAGQASRRAFPPPLSLRTLPASSTTVTPQNTVTTSPTTVPTSPSTVSATPSSDTAPPSTVPVTPSDDSAPPSQQIPPTTAGDVVRTPADPSDTAESTSDEKANVSAAGGTTTSGTTNDEALVEEDGTIGIGSDERKDAENETEINGEALVKPPNVKTQTNMTEGEEEGEELKGMDDMMSTTELSFTDNIPTDHSPVEQMSISEGGDSVAEVFLREFNVSGSGLHFAFPMRFLNTWFTSLFSPKATEGASPSLKMATEGAHAHPRAFLKEGSGQEPILASTAPTHTRAARTAPCSRPCGGGTRLVTQACVEITEPEMEVSEELCDGLPNFVAPFNQSCNTFPCAAPRWVSGPWGECSAWCGVGLRHRLVVCGLPLLQDGSPLAAGYFLPHSRCNEPQPKSVHLCSGPCLPVDCSLPENLLHPACYDLLQDTPLEQDHIP